MLNNVVGFKINGTTYEYDHDHLANIPAIDPEPVQNSARAVQSGGVYSAVKKLDDFVKAGLSIVNVNLKSLMTDHDKVYLYTGTETGESTGYWYYYNGTQFVPGGLYGAGVQIDAVPTQGSTNAVSSGGVKSALDAVTAQIPQIDPTLTQSGQAADAKVTGDKINALGSALNSNATIGNIVTGKYINNAGTESTDMFYDCCDFVDISGFVKVEFSVSMFSARGLAFYDKDKNTILAINGNNCSSYGYTESSIPQAVKLAIPNNAVYLRFTRRNIYDVTTVGFAVSGINYSGLVGTVKQLQKDVDAIDVTAFVKKDGTDEVTVNNAEFLDTVFINAFNGDYINGITIAGSGFVPSGYTLRSSATRYNAAIIPIKPSTKYTLCCKTNSENAITLGRAVTATKILVTGESFDGSVYINFESATNSSIKTFTSGENDAYLYVYGLNYTDLNGSQFIQLYEGETNTFTTNKYSVSVGIPNDKLILGINEPGIKIKPVSATRFNVLISDQASGKWITHTFLKATATNTISDTSVVTESVWRAEYIKDADGNTIMQGNTNYIHSLDETGHVGHVGAGHGCAVAVWTLFFADGQQFTPETLDHEIACSCFRMTEKVNHYLIDQSATSSSSNAIPTMENGEPVIESVEYLDAEWTVNNRMKIRNRLDIVKDSIKFLDCYAGMLTGYYPYFDHIILNNPEYIYNKLSGTGNNITVSNIGGTNTVISQFGSMEFKGDEVTIFGDKYRCRTRIIANDPTRYTKLNIESAALPPNADNRIKFYFVPCVCSPAADAEVFSTGEILDVMITKELDIVG